ncbi:MAG: hypothetical protein ACR2OM_00220, partial [Aestuariivirgaceae bacterium]
LSFMRTLIRLIGQEKWQFENILTEWDDNGFGRAVWHIHSPHGVLSFVAFTNDLAPEERTDRVIAERWDASFALLDGTATPEDIARLEANVPRQEAGRVSPKELVLSRANKSVRLFEYVSSCLARGEQPDIAELVKVGYLMRTTAVYGNGKFGLGDYPKAARNPAFCGPFRAEMLLVFMVRHFQFELVNHIAVAKGGSKAVPLSADRAAVLGIGNSTGLGMAPFILRHPVLFHHWIEGRETALARVRSIAAADPAKHERCAELLERAARHIAQWNVDDERQQTRIVKLRQEVQQLREHRLQSDHPWDELYGWAESNLSLEAQELVVSLLIELYPEFVDSLADRMGESAGADIDPSMRLCDLKSAIERDYDWALNIDFSDSTAREHFWYYSEDKEEPRLGKRFEEPGADKEMRLGMAWYVSQLHQRLAAMAAGELDNIVAAFLLAEPQWRLAVRRVMTTAKFPYAEIRDNTIGAELLAIDMLRCKLSFFGATKFDPRSDKWTRITMFQGAPLISDLTSADADDWWLPVIAGI